MSWTTWNGQRLIQRTDEVMAQGVNNAVEAIGSISDQQVPHDEGILQGSKAIRSNPRNKLQVSISYGGGAGTGFPRVPYAVRWHENSASFQKGRKSNYLRDPVFVNGPAILRRSLQQQARRVW